MFKSNRSLSSLVCTAALLLLSACANATNYYVAIDGKAGNNGLSPGSPFTTIQAGIEAAHSGDTVYVAAGTYYEHDLDFQGRNITIQGAGAAPPFSFASGTIVNCESMGRGFVFHSGETRDAKLSGLSIVNGWVEDGSSYPLSDTDNSAGGAIRIIDSSPTISNCSIGSCYSEGAGGGIAATGGSPRIENTLMYYCFSFSGGGIFAAGSNVEMINTYLVVTSANIGAGVTLVDGNCKLINTTFGGISPLYNEFDERAATLTAIGSTVLVANSIFYFNETPSEILSFEGWATITVQNSDVAGSGGSDNWSLAGIVDGGGNIEADPKPASEYLDPAEDSPCVNAGDSSVYNLYASGLTLDFQGNPRIRGRIDMGWLESPYGPADSTPPAITIPGNLTAAATSTAGAVVNFNVTATDDVDGPVAVICTPASGSTFKLGTTTVTCTARDAAGNEATTSFTVTVTYSWSGFLQPINSDGSSVFKAGSTVSVKFQLTGASAGIANAVAKLSYTRVGDASGTVNEAVSNGAGDSGNQFRYDLSSRQYMYNWSTKGITPGNYQLSIDLGDGVSRTVNIRLK